MHSQMNVPRHGQNRPGCSARLGQAEREKVGRAARSVLVAQLGARMHYAVPWIFHRYGMLERFYTDLDPRRLPLGLLNRCPLAARSLPSRLRARRVPVPETLVRDFQLFGLEYAWRRKTARTASEALEVHLWAGDRFNELVIRGGLGAADLVYGHRSASHKLFEFARRRGVRTVLEQTILPKAAERQLMEEERQLWPGWGGSSEDESADAFVEREHAEWELADRVVCGSDFVADEVRRLTKGRCRCVTVPYGVELPGKGRSLCRPEHSAGPLKVLFVGGVGLRKGVPYLLHAAKAFNSRQVLLRVVGPISCDRQSLKSLCSRNVELVGPVTRDAVDEQYRWADVFCLPSICEGSATVVYEALACGLPVVTTPNAGSIVRDGVEGFIVPIRDSERIAQSLERLIDDEELRTEMARNALARSAYGSREAYARRLVAAVLEMEREETVMG